MPSATTNVNVKHDLRTSTSVRRTISRNAKEYILILVICFFMISRLERRVHSRLPKINKFIEKQAISVKALKLGLKVNRLLPIEVVNTVDDKLLPYNINISLLDTLKTNSIDINKVLREKLREVNKKDLELLEKVHKEKKDITYQLEKSIKGRFTKSFSFVTKWLTIFSKKAKKANHKADEITTKEIDNNDYSQTEIKNNSEAEL